MCVSNWGATRYQRHGSRIYIFEFRYFEGCKILISRYVLSNPSGDQLFQGRRRQRTIKVSVHFDLRERTSELEVRPFVFVEQGRHAGPQTVVDLPPWIGPDWTSSYVLIHTQGRGGLAEASHERRSAERRAWRPGGPRPVGDSRQKALIIPWPNFQAAVSFSVSCSDSLSKSGIPQPLKSWTQERRVSVCKTKVS